MADRSELEDFCRREHPRLVRSLTLYTGDALIAEEFAQDALVAACRRWGEVALMAAPAAWLHRVAINYANGYFRRLRAERRALRKAYGGAKTSYELPDSATAIALRAALGRLPTRQRSVLILRFFADLDVADTANALTISSEAVRSLTHRAINALRQHGHEFDSLDRGEVSGAS